MNNSNSNSNSNSIISGIIPEDIAGWKKLLCKIIFRKVEIDKNSLNLIKEHTEKGIVIYALFHSTPLLVVMLYYLLKINKIKTPIFAVDYITVFLQRFRFVLQSIFIWFKKTILRKKIPYILETDYIEKIVRNSNSNSIVFPIISQKYFLRRYLETKHDSLVYFIELQKKIDKPIFIMPQVIFWNRNPERSRSFFTPSATGHKHLFSGLLSLLNPTFIHNITPINLQEKIEKFPGKDPHDIAVEIRENLIEEYQHEKRQVLGPELKSKSEMMEKILYHENVLTAIKEISISDKVSEKKLKKKAYKYFKEIAADFSVRYINFLGRIVEFIFKRVFKKFVYDPKVINKIREYAKKGPIVYVPSHKSHMDYLIISYLLYKNRYMAPYIAAGVNLSFFPMGTIFRHSGAFFLRRSFKGMKLYPLVFKQYLKTLVNESYPMEIFIEGGRTRTGRIVAPKLGFLNYLLEAIDENYNEDIVFLPISITYDRVLEEKSYVREVKGKSKKKENFSAIIKSRNILKREYGSVRIKFDDPFCLKDVEKDGFSGETRAQEIANRIVNGINKVTTINQISLVTTAMLLVTTSGFSKENLINNTKLIYNYLRIKDVIFAENIQGVDDLDAIINNVIKIFLNDNIITEVTYDEGEKIEDILILNDESRPAIAFYKNTIQHFLIDIGVISLAILYNQNKNDTIEISNIKEHLEFFKDLFSIEFFSTNCFKDPAAVISEVTSGYMVENGLLINENNILKINIKHKHQLVLFSRIIVDIIESYYIVLNTIFEHKKNSLSLKELMADIRKNGVKLYHTGKIKFIESLSLPNYKNCIKKFIEKSFIEEKDVSKNNSKLKIKNRNEFKFFNDELEKYKNLL